MIVKNAGERLMKMVGVTHQRVVVYCISSSVLSQSKLLFRIIKARVGRSFKLTFSSAFHWDCYFFRCAQQVGGMWVEGFMLSAGLSTKYQLRRQSISNETVSHCAISVVVIANLWSLRYTAMGQWYMYRP